MTFERARAVADAVLLEGYVLYPYRSCSTKNRYRWTFGVLAPRDWSEAGGCEPSWLEAQVLVERTTGHRPAEAGGTPKLRGRLRFLQVVDRRIEVRGDDDDFHEAPRLEVDGELFVPWEEGDVREIDFDVAVDPRQDERVMPFSVPASADLETIRDASGRIAGRVVRTRAALEGEICIRSVLVESEGEPIVRVSIRVENVTSYPLVLAERAEVMRASCISTHVLLVVEDGRFVSLLDPPPHARAAAKTCVSVRAHPVLAGQEDRCDLMLCSPIILYDHPQIAPESPGDFFDATEIDAMLALRTRTLTPDEKNLARATDPRSAALLDRVESMSHDALERLHGAMRDQAPVPPLAPATPSLPSHLAPGKRVRLRLDGAKRRTDAQDLLYSGRAATIESVREDVDGRAYLLVTIDDDPAAEMHRWKGRYHYYYPDEVEPL